MSPTSIVACNDCPNPRGHSIVYFVVGLLTHRIEHSLPSHPRRSPLAGKHTNNGLLSEEVSIATFRLQRFTAAGPSRICFLTEAENAPKFPVHEIWSFQTSPPRTSQSIPISQLLSNKLSTMHFSATVFCGTLSRREIQLKPDYSSNPGER